MDVCGLLLPDPGTVYDMTIEFSKPDSQADKFVASFCLTPSFLNAALSLFACVKFLVELLNNI
jgi:hypothetical protein